MIDDIKKEVKYLQNQPQKAFNELRLGLTEIGSFDPIATVVAAFIIIFLSLYFRA